MPTLRSVNSRARVVCVASEDLLRTELLVASEQSLGTALAIRVTRVLNKREYNPRTYMMDLASQ